MNVCFFEVLLVLVCFVLLCDVMVCENLVVYFVLFVDFYLFEYLFECW